MITASSYRLRAVVGVDLIETKKDVPRVARRASLSNSAIIITAELTLDTAILVLRRFGFRCGLLCSPQFVPLEGLDHIIVSDKKVTLKLGLLSCQSRATERERVLRYLLLAHFLK